MGNEEQRAGRGPITTAVLFAQLWRTLGNTEQRVEALREELRKFPRRPHRELAAKLNTPCGRCGQVVRVGANVCWLPAVEGGKSVVFHWPCAPGWVTARAEELALACTRNAVETLDRLDETILGDSALLAARVAVLHAERFPAGCPGLCEACVARLGIPLVTCTTCRRQNVPVVDGKLKPHDRYVGGRPGYRARAQACEASGRKIR